MIQNLVKHAANTMIHDQHDLNKKKNVNIYWAESTSLEREREPKKCLS